jgi:hypothetical protein
MPHLFVANDYKHVVTDNDINVCSQLCTFRDCVCDADFYELCNILMNEMNVTMPTDPASAVDLYKTLRPEIQNAV